jgi:hypothetical protein
MLGLLPGVVNAVKPGEACTESGRNVCRLQTSSSRWLERTLAIRQLIIVALSGILRKVLDELPIVALGIVEVATLAVRM